MIQRRLREAERGLRRTAGVKVRVRLPPGAFQVQSRGQKSKTDSVLPVSHSRWLPGLQTQSHVRTADLAVCGDEGVIRSLIWSVSRCKIYDAAPSKLSDPLYFQLQHKQTKSYSTSSAFLAHFRTFFPSRISFSVSADNKEKYKHLSSLE